ncbi:MAG TPA: FtsX-like permease family protein [Candidatus Limnocylindria bacterium]|nr:FtsX-like permease family protein [Candidatus Limnocylindria bacterium]
MHRRLLLAALWRRRGMVALAVFAVALGATLASALLHVSGDIGDKLTRELRALGPNLLLVPAGDGSGSAYLHEASVRARLARPGLSGVTLLYAVADVEGRAVQLVGADLEAARLLHPTWSVPAGGPQPTSLIGARLFDALGAGPGRRLNVRFGGQKPILWPAGVRLEAGGADDQAWWVPLAELQRHTGREGQVSLAQVRVDGDLATVRAVAAELEGAGMQAIVLHALAATEGRVLDRTRSLMALVTVAALLAAGLCALGTLTDLALERRRDIALIKALGATRRDVVRLFAGESLAIGLIGGLLGAMLGYGLARLIGHQVFHAAIAPRWDVPLLVLALSAAVAVLAGLGPIRFALAVEPALALKGE